MLLVGSRALEAHFPGTREPRDWDFFTSYEELRAWCAANRGELASLMPNPVGTKFRAKFRDGGRAEFELTDRVPSAAAFVAAGRGEERRWHAGRFTAALASPAALLAIKRSHLHLPLTGWAKHLEDYHVLKGLVSPGSLTPEEGAAYEMRRAEAEDRSRAKLVSSNEEFFAKSEGALGRFYIHDDLHRATCYGDRPLFERCKRDLSRAWLSEVLFRELGERDRLRLVREEAYAIALERVVVPRLEHSAATREDLPGGGARYGLGYHQAWVGEGYRHALFRLGTTLSKGWFREYLLEHWPELKTCEVDYVAKFLAAAGSGVIKRREGLCRS